MQEPKHSALRIGVKCHANGMKRSGFAPTFSILICVGILALGVGAWYYRSGRRASSPRLHQPVPVNIGAVLNISGDAGGINGWDQYPLRDIREAVSDLNARGIPATLILKDCQSDFAMCEMATSQVAAEHVPVIIGPSWTEMFILSAAKIAEEQHVVLFYGGSGKLSGARCFGPYVFDFEAMRSELPMERIGQFVLERGWNQVAVVSYGDQAELTIEVRDKVFHLISKTVVQEPPAYGLTESTIHRLTAPSPDAIVLPVELLGEISRIRASGYRGALLTTPDIESILLSSAQNDWDKSIISSAEGVFFPIPRYFDANEFIARQKRTPFRRHITYFDPYNTVMLASRLIQEGATTGEKLSESMLSRKSYEMKVIRMGKSVIYP